jgi:hypothetical protein
MHINHHQSEHIMTIGKILTSASLALAILGGTIAFTPASVEAAGKGRGRDKIYCPAQVGHPCWEKNFPAPKPIKKKCKTRVCLH